SIGQTVLDNQLTDANGLTIVRVQDGGLVSTHKRFMGIGAWMRQTVAVLPGDSSVAIRMLYYDERITPQPVVRHVRADVSGLPGGSYPAVLQASQNSSCSTSIPGNGPTSLTL